MGRYLVVVTIENKDQVGDPEGETIKKDLIIRSGYSNVESVRSAKCYNIIIITKSEEDAKKEVTKLCEELRIYNPIVSNCTIGPISKLNN
ncbi:MAG: phosphoribosylformylglycinamidine synthase subunit PurS [Nitrososphaeraceae archaeon]|jgi:phosphoribosylformylglycinamidine synthase subunit PurS|nr:phosphoribosylformylglycinamidine synthase subunit PurS [Nitrososphaeraceae archaeon]MDW0146506.1 phosphoribosylformylglycinamidine synthase subunit PurS [Nitrososphaeraceae archaeon]MDW0152927.1 phosphoribosylformylglycinamidine synthase subunit PurS [Nitrososphaeraceae archaeon]MDW3654286.1 phosphoribosylformylglycinamidine synthase subunit PurS [Nitrososphaeraceae archaeon]